MRQDEKISAINLALAALISMAIMIATASADANGINTSSVSSSLENISLDNSTGSSDEAAYVAGVPVYEGPNSTSISDASETNGTANQMPQSNGSRTAEVAAYVYNDDDDSEEVSLYIDSIPKGKTEVDKGSEELIGNYTLDTGIHRFKMIWKDPDTEKSYESEIKREVYEDDIVRLYTTEHTEPQKFDVLVSVKNENENKTNAYLYIDGKFQNSQELTEKEISEFDEVSVEEGVHDISLKWLDPDTNIEYEKKKRITVDDDKAVVFVAPRGISFGSVGSASSTSDESKYESASYESSEPSNSLSTDIASESSSDSSDLSSNASTIINDGSGSKSGDGFAGIDMPQGIFSSRIKESPGAYDESSSDPSGETSGMSGDISAYPIIYLAVLLIAIYLVFRR